MFLAIISSNGVVVGGSINVTGLVSTNNSVQGVFTFLCRFGCVGAYRGYVCVGLGLLTGSGGGAFLSVVGYGVASSAVTISNSSVDGNAVQGACVL